jgi:hypothetical protein
LPISKLEIPINFKDLCMHKKMVQIFSPTFLVQGWDDQHKYEGFLSSSKLYVGREKETTTRASTACLVLSGRHGKTPTRMARHNSTPRSAWCGFFCVFIFSNLGYKWYGIPSRYCTTAGIFSIPNDDVYMQTGE